MDSAAHRVHRIDNVFRVLVQHCSKPLLVKIMMLEKKGTIFDECVKELYREVDYDILENMTRDTPRRSQYLDAVIRVKSDAPCEVMSKYMPPRLSDVRPYAKPCLPNATSPLQVKCPNVQIIARHEVGRSGQVFTIILEKGKNTGFIRFHERIDIVPRSPSASVTAPHVSGGMGFFWNGWTTEYSAGLVVHDAAYTTYQKDKELKALLLDTDQLNQKITEIQTGWLPFTLSELGDIALSRYPNKSPISRISSTVASFPMLQFDQFILKAGVDLTQLHLHTQPSFSRITPLDLPAIVRLLRSQCPNLVDLRLPMSFSVGFGNLNDADIELPPYHLAPGPGTIRKLTILGYNLGKRQYSDLDEICSKSGMSACARFRALLDHWTDNKLEIRIHRSDRHASGELVRLGEEAERRYTILPEVSIPRFYSVNTLTYRLGPILEPRLALRSTNPLGIPSFDFLEDLKYEPDGRPIWLWRLDETWSNSKKSKWHDSRFCPDDDEDDEYYEYLMDQQQQRKDMIEAYHQEYNDYLDEFKQEKQDAQQESLDDMEQDGQAELETDDEHLSDSVGEEGSQLEHDQLEFQQERSDQLEDGSRDRHETHLEVNIQEQPDAEGNSVETVPQKRPHTSNSSNGNDGVDRLTARPRIPDDPVDLTDMAKDETSREYDRGDDDTSKKPRLDDKRGDEGIDGGSSDDFHKL